MSFLRTILRSPVGHYWLYGVAFVVISIVVWLSAYSSISVKSLSQRSYNSYQCETVAGSASRPEQIFRILDLFILDADSLANALCQDPAFAQRYTQVNVSWMHRDQIDLRSLFNQQYELIFSKPELLNHLAEGVSDNYLALAKHADYASQLIALNTVPQLSNDYFRGKRLGLIDDPLSLSGYQIPKAALKKADIDDTLYEVISYKSHDLLHRALLLGEIDVMASFAPIGSVQNTTARKSLLLQEKLLGPRWYLQSELLEQEIHCRVITHLQAFAARHVSPYINDISVLRGCLREA
ncbi:MAG TPA: hypothetical protein ENI05_00145 [Porticoccus sp.]|nr:hypothetical protein [Porticoccus sp.]